MIVTFETVPNRLEYVNKKLIPQFKNSHVEVFTDYEKRGTEWAFKQMLKYDFEGYRLHLQDDIIIVDGLEEHLKILTEKMKKEVVHVLNLFVPFRFDIPEDVKDGDFMFYKNFSWLQGTIFSRPFVNIMRREANKITGVEDDKFVLGCLKKHRLKSYVHYPSLVQHRIDVPSEVWNIKNGSTRKSKTFNKKYLKQKL